MTPQAAPELSIILVNFNTPHLTLECIRSIHRHSPAVPFEVIVIQNGSDARLESVLKQRFPGTRFIATGANLGFSKAVNLGIHNSHGAWIGVLNNDAQISGPVFDRMIEYALARPRAGIVGPRHIGHDGQFQLSSGHFPTFFSEIVRKLVYHRLSLNDWKLRDYLDDRYSSSGPVDWVSGSCLLARRKALQATGLFDERFFMYFEDIDLCTRARRAGWEVHYFASETVTHIGGASVKKNLLSALIANRRSQLYFSRKYFGRLGETMVRLIVLFKYGKTLLFWGAVYLFSKERKMRAKSRAYEMALLAKHVLAAAAAPVPNAFDAPVLAPSEAPAGAQAAPAQPPKNVPGRSARLLESPSE